MDRTFEEAVAAKQDDFEQVIEVAQAFVDALWEPMREAYIAAGEPYGPHTEIDNVGLWITEQGRRIQQEWDTYDSAMEEWAVADTQARLHGEGGVRQPEEPRGR